MELTLQDICTNGGGLAILQCFMFASRKKHPSWHGMMHWFGQELPKEATQILPRTTSHSLKSGCVFFLFQLVQDFTRDLPLKSYWSRILFSLGSQHGKQCNCKSTTGVFPWLSAGKAKGLWGILFCGIYFLQLQSQGAPRPPRCLRSDSSCPLRNVQESHTHSNWIRRTRIQKVSIPMNPSSIYQQNQILCICRYLHWFPRHLKYCFIHGLKSPTKQRMSSEWGLTHSCFLEVYKYSYFILIALLL